MKVDDAYLQVLDSSAKLQLNMAAILEAKAVEAEKVRNWMCNHVDCNAFPNQSDLVKETMQVHEQLIEVIDGLSKVSQGISSVLKVVLRSGAESEKDGMGGMFGGGFDMDGGGKFS